VAARVVGVTSWVTPSEISRGPHFNTPANNNKRGGDVVGVAIEPVDDRGRDVLRIAVGELDCCHQPVFSAEGFFLNETSEPGIADAFEQWTNQREVDRGQAGEQRADAQHDQGGAVVTKTVSGPARQQQHYGHNADADRDSAQRKQKLPS